MSDIIKRGQRGELGILPPRAGEEDYVLGRVDSPPPGYRGLVMPNGTADYPVYEPDDRDARAFNLSSIGGWTPDLKDENYAVVDQAWGAMPTGSGKPSQHNSAPGQIGTHGDMPPQSQAEYAQGMGSPTEDKGQFAEIMAISPEDLRQVVKPGRRAPQSADSIIADDVAQGPSADEIVAQDSRNSESPFVRPHKPTPMPETAGERRQNLTPGRPPVAAAPTSPITPTSLNAFNAVLEDVGGNHQVAVAEFAKDLQRSGLDPATAARRANEVGMAARRPGPALPRAAAEGRPAVAKAPAPKQAKPLDAALVRPVAMNAGPEEVAGPLPDEAAPRAPKDNRQAMDVLNRLWTRWSRQMTTAPADSKEWASARDDFFKQALAKYGEGVDHLSGIKAVNEDIIKGLRTERDVAARDEVRTRMAQDARARRMGMTMPVYQFYIGAVQSGMAPDEALLAAAHATNPQAGWGNLLALTRKQRAENEQMKLTMQKDNPAGPMDKIQQAITQVVAAGANPATLDQLRLIYRQMPGNQADQKGADRFALDNAASLYLPLHGQANIGPSQQQFVHRYINSFTTYDDFINHNRLEDTPANQRIWTAITKRPVKTGFQRGMDAIGTAVAAGAEAVGGFFGGQQPAANQQAQAAPRRPFD